MRREGQGHEARRPSIGPARRGPILGEVENAVKGEEGGGKGERAQGRG